MAQASARRSFHGPLLVTSGSPKPSAHSGPLSLAPAPVYAGPLGRTSLVGTGAEAPTTNERERLMASVLAALRNLTGGRR